MQNLESNSLLQGGKYKIISVLGQGSFGITYLAEHTNLERKVAIKEFFMNQLNTRGDDGSVTGMSENSLPYNYAQKFRKEATNLAMIEHPNIVRVTDSFQENGTYYYAMDYIEGTNLNDYVKKNTLSEDEVILIIKDVADALIYMHEQKRMLHLDLKPGNVMRRNSDGHIFLIDFGLSKHFSDDGHPETSTTIGLGTAGYAPIEQGNRALNGEFRPTIDVYALGATLYKLLTRETPPAASDIVSDDELLERNMKDKNISQNLIDLVVKAMLPNVNKRIQNVRLFKEMLENRNSESKIASDTKSEETIIGSNEETIIAGQKSNETIIGDNKKEESQKTERELNNATPTGRNSNTKEISSKKERMTFGKYVRTCMRKYVVFKGRASRAEYWWFNLFAFIASFVLLVVFDELLHLWPYELVVPFIFVLPGLSVAVRRCHDSGHSGWLLFCPIFNLIIMFYASEHCDNKYGEEP